MISVDRARVMYMLDALPMILEPVSKRYLLGTESWFGAYHRDCSEVMKQLVEKRPGVHLLIVGTGSYESALQAQVASLGLSGRVIFAGHREDVSVLLGAGDVFVLPTLRDALPAVVIDALPVGTPVVASDIDRLPEMIDDGITGLLVPPADSAELAGACLKLLTQPGLSGSVALAAGLAAEQRLGMDEHVKRVSDLYDDAIAESNGDIG